MINWRFILKPGSVDELEMEEPAGFSDAEFVLLRDQVYHGVSVAFSNKVLELQGDSAIMVKDAYDLLGTDAEITLRIILECEDESEEYSEDFSLDFNTYKEHCGSDCRVLIGFAEISCFTLFRNNLDKKVDLNAVKAFDGTTDLSDYEWIKKEITLEPVGMIVEADASVAVERDEINLIVPFDSSTAFQADVMIRPTYIDKRIASITTSQLDDPFNFYEFTDDQQTLPISPQILLEDNPLCFDGDFDYNIRFKGDFDFSVTGATAGMDFMALRIVKWDGVGSIVDDGVLVEEWEVPFSPTVLPNFPVSGTFDHTFTGSTTLENGQGFYAFLFFHAATSFDDGEITFLVNFDPETSFNVTAFKLCPSTQADVYGLFEIASRIAESISNKCLTLDSNYYGRTDSEPTAYPVDGCGSLRCLTSGLYIRRAETPTFFQSFKELIDGLRCIDNIGFGLQKVQGNEILKIEPVRYFYSDEELIRLPHAASVETQVSVNDLIGLVKAGYEKWEPESVNGLDEFNSTREYRLQMKSTKQTLDITCKMIAAGYVLEVTRQQSFATTGAADTRYDNDTFIICLERAVYPVLIVEQGNITSPANMVDPGTVYNYRISPIRNLMRWFKSVVGSYRDHTTAGNDLIFSSGKGNLLAEGILVDDCSPEASVMSESENIEIADFKSTLEATPFLRPENVTFEYPMSLSDFNRIRANPYGYISYQCGENWLKGYINQLKYRPTNGVASFDLRKKYE